MKLPIAEWLYKWLNENPEASIEDGLKAYQLARENDSQEISDDDILKEAIEHSKLYTNKFTPRNAFIMGAKWYREQLKSKGNG